MHRGGRHELIRGKMVVKVLILIKIKLNKRYISKTKAYLEALNRKQPD
jgi:hypothetical protein